MTIGNEIAKRKKILFSGIQPSGHLHLGAYLGALRNWVRLQQDYDCIFCIVDMHAVTIRQDPKDLHERCLSFLAQYLAAGIDPQVSTVFIQSHVAAHAQLAWVLNCSTYMGELSRMTQFKVKTQDKNDANIGVGLFDYPVLMAADILLYGTSLVPVGADQKQHLELTRDLAIRMNRLYGPVFTVPEAYIGEVGARVMSLQDPTAKMSKSDANPGSYIALLDEPDVIRKKIKRAVMDSQMGITYEPETRPGVANLLSIYAALNDETPAVVAARYADKGNAALKGDLAELVVAFMEPFQQHYHELMQDHDYLQLLLRKGAEAAEERATPRLRAVYKALGFPERSDNLADMKWPE